MTQQPYLSVKILSKHFKPAAFSRGPVVKALQDISFDIPRGQVVGLVGESGSGKTTIGRSVLRLIEPTSGEVKLDGVDITTLSAGQLRQQRRKMQYIFQDPFASLSPRMTIGQVLTEGLDIQGIGTRAERRARAEKALAAVELPVDAFDRYAHEFSGGQRQRVGIARALTLDPEFIVADEPVSALDVSIQAQVINLLRDLQVRLGLTMLFISHDLAVVEYICDTVIVLYLGRIMEIAPAADLYGGAPPPPPTGPGGRKKNPPPARPPPRSLCPPHPPLYAGAALSHSLARPCGAPAAADPHRRYPEPRQSAIRLRVPHALPLCHRGLRRWRARPARGCARPRPRLHSRRYSLIRGRSADRESAGKRFAPAWVITGL